MRTPQSDNIKIVVEILTPVDQEFHKDMIVTTEELQHAIKALNSGKSLGHDNISSEHFKYASCKLIVILSICITCMFIHNYTPDDCIKTVMLPLVKEECREYSLCKQL